MIFYTKINREFSNIYSICRTPMIFRVCKVCTSVLWWSWIRKQQQRYGSASIFRVYLRRRPWTFFAGCGIFFFCSRILFRKARTTQIRRHMNFIEGETRIDFCFCFIFSSLITSSHKPDRQRLLRSYKLDRSEMNFAVQTFLRIEYLHWVDWFFVFRNWFAKYYFIFSLSLAISAWYSMHFLFDFFVTFVFVFFTFTFCSHLAGTSRLSSATRSMN